MYYKHEIIHETTTRMPDKQRLRMVLHFGHYGIFKRVAVPFDKDLGSPETAAEIACAFGVAATAIESLAVKQMPQRNSSTLGLPFENLPLNLNGHDLEHAFNRRLHSLLFGEGCYLDVVFKKAEARRPSAPDLGDSFADM